MVSSDRTGRTGLAGLLAANALTALFALWQGWSLILLLWPCWLQSLAIGWFARKRVLALPDAPGATDDARSRRTLANLMGVHYGIFLFASLFFIIEFSDGVKPWDWMLIAIAGASFAWGHKRSHALNVDADRAGGRNPASLMALPYVRVLPMDLAIVAGALAGAEGWVVLGFCALKTVADAVMHIVEHWWLQGRGPG